VFQGSDGELGGGRWDLGVAAGVTWRRRQVGPGGGGRECCFIATGISTVGIDTYSSDFCITASFTLGCIFPV
jgi:hypothetical protein